jgi:hypothetical protein
MDNDEINLEILRRAEDLLNSLHGIDPDFVNKLLELSECNADISEHPYVMTRNDGNGKYSMGVLGILNGLSRGAADKFLARKLGKSNETEGFCIVDQGGELVEQVEFPHEDEFAKALFNDEDPYKAVAASIFEVPVDSVTPKMRKHAKFYSCGLFVGKAKYQEVINKN